MSFSYTGTIKTFRVYLVDQKGTDYNSFWETVQASSSFEARRIVESKYPHLKVHGTPQEVV